jgi:hypothetical protein
MPGISYDDFIGYDRFDFQIIDVYAGGSSRDPRKKTGKGDYNGYTHSDSPSMARNS